MQQDEFGLGNPVDKRPVMKQNSRSLKKYVLLCGIYFGGVLFGLLLWERIILPFRNPWNVTGPLTQIEYNPANDFIRFTVFIVLPAILLTAVFFLRTRRISSILFRKNEPTWSSADTEFSSNAPKPRKAIYFWLSIVFVIITGLNVPTFHASGEFDTFHEGEVLGVGASFAAGKVPYKDILCLPGIFQIPLRVVISFALFKRSIGAVRTLESIIKIITFVLLFTVIAMIFRGNYLNIYTTYLILLLFITLPAFHAPPYLLIPPRDVTTFGFLAVFLFLRKSVARSDSSIVIQSFAVFLFSFIPIASFVYSIDRGFYLSAAYLVLWPIMFWIGCKNQNSGVHFAVSTCMGILAGILVIGGLIDWEFSEFVQYVFVIMPKYKELIEGTVYPIKDIGYLFFVCMIAFNLFFIVYRLLVEVYGRETFFRGFLEFIERHLIEIGLLILSIFFFRSALGRSDWGHVIYSSSLSYILSIYLAIKYWFQPLLSQHDRVRKTAVYVLVVGVIGVALFSLYRINQENVIMENFPLNVEDAEFIPANYQETIKFIKRELASNENFFTMTNEGAWYYFLDKPYPTRFPVDLYAGPSFYQQEIVRDLERNSVKLILYRNNHWANHIDGFTSQKRLPIVDNYIRTNYAILKKIDDNELWIKR